MTQTLPILIVGLPRSGTTWVGEVFSSARNTNYIFEPDNEGLSPLAWLCKRDMHRFPYLAAKDESTDYHHLWRTTMYGTGWTWLANNALSMFLRKRFAEVEAHIGDKSGYVYVDRSMHRVGEKRLRAYRLEEHPVLAFLVRQLITRRALHHRNRRTIVKSVHATLSADWISSHFPVQMVFVLRNAYSLYASYKRMKIPDGFRNLLSQEILQRDSSQYHLKRAFMVEKDEPIVFQIMLMYKIIESQISAHPEWTLISHDRLCMVPHVGYRQAFESLGLEWSNETDIRIDALNKSGKGFDPKRVSDQQPFKWKSEINSGEQTMIEKWIDVFGLNSFFQTYIDLI
jgi:hypothetical protein